MKGLLLISGGIDSPVAGYIMAKRGLQVGAVHFTMFPYSRKEQEKKAALLVAQLSKLIGKKVDLYFVDIGKAHSLFLARCNRKYQCVLCRRTMYRCSEMLAKNHGYDCIVTGENIGQVASQTIDNMAVIDSAVKIPVLRPILCNEKLDTIKLAKEIGTYETSILQGDCCRLVPNNPATRATIEEISKEEGKLDINSLTKELVNSTKIMECC